MPSFLNLISFTNHIEIINRCKAIEEHVFYVLYSYRERLKVKESLDHKALTSYTESEDR